MLKNYQKFIALFTLFIAIGAFYSLASIVAPDSQRGVLKLTKQSHRNGAYIQPGDLIEARFEFINPAKTSDWVNYPLCEFRSKIEYSPGKFLNYHSFSSRYASHSPNDEKKEYTLALPVFDFDLAWSKYGDPFNIYIYWSCSSDFRYDFSKPLYTLKFKNGQKEPSPSQKELVQKYPDGFNGKDPLIAGEDFIMILQNGQIHLKKGTTINFAEKNSRVIFSLVGKGNSRFQMGKTTFDLPSETAYMFSGGFLWHLNSPKNLTVEVNGEEVELKRRMGMMFDDEGRFIAGIITRTVKLKALGQNFTCEKGSEIQIVYREGTGIPLFCKQEGPITKQVCGQTVEISLMDTFYNRSMSPDGYVLARDVTLNCPKFTLHARKGHEIYLGPNDTLLAYRTSKTDATLKTAEDEFVLKHNYKHKTEFHENGSVKTIEGLSPREFKKRLEEAIARRKAPNKYVEVVAYNRSKGEAQMVRFSHSGVARVLEKYTDWRKTWDTIVSGNFLANKREQLFLYDQRAGEAELLEFDSEGVITLKKSHPGFRKKLDTVIPGHFTNKRQEQLFLYDKAAGQATIVGFNKSGELSLNKSLDIQEGFDEIAAGNFLGNGKTQLIFYDRETGTVVLVGFNSRGKINLNKQMGWRTTWLGFVAGDFIGNKKDQLMVFDPEKGQANIVGFDRSGKMNLNQATRGWRKTWKVFIAGEFTGNGKTQVLLYDPNDGNGTIVGFSSSGKQDLNGSNPGWRKVWQLITPGIFIHNNKSQVLLYDRKAGEVAIVGFKKSGRVNLDKTNKGWQKNWDMIIPANY